MVKIKTELFGRKNMDIGIYVCERRWVMMNDIILFI